MPRPDPSPSSDASVRAQIAAFLETHHAAPFRDDRAGAGDVARAFLELCREGLGLSPDHLDDEHLRELLVRDLPPRLDPSQRSAARAPAIVRAFLEWHGERYPNPSGWKLGAVIDEAEPAFARSLVRVGGRSVAADPTPITRPGAKLGRNDPCPCGSGKKYKKCCAGS